MGSLDRILNKPSKAEIHRFNLFMSFDYMPKIVEAHNFRHSSFKEGLKFNILASEQPLYYKLLKQVNVYETDVKNWPNVKLYLISLPSNENMPEVACAIIGYESTMNVTKLYTMEHSIGGFAVCNPTTNSHNNLGVFVKDGTEFGAFCLKNFIDYINNLINSEY